MWNSCLIVFYENASTFYHYTIDTLLVYQLHFVYLCSQSPHGSKVQSRSSSPFPWNRATNFNATLPTAPDRLDSNDPALPLVLCSLLQREFAMKSPGRSRKGVYKDEQEEEDEDEDYSVPFTLTTQHKGIVG